MAKVTAEFVGYENPETGEVVTLLHGEDTAGKGIPAEVVKLWHVHGMVAMPSELPDEKPKAKTAAKPKPAPKPEPAPAPDTDPAAVAPETAADLPA